MPTMLQLKQSDCTCHRAFMESFTHAPNNVCVHAQTLVFQVLACRRPTWHVPLCLLPKADNDDATTGKGVLAVFIVIALAV